MASDGRGEERQYMASDGRGEESGSGSSHRFSNSDFLEFLADLDYPHVAGTSDVATGVGCAERTAHKRLQELADDGRVKKKTIGNGQRVVWFLPESDMETGPEGAE